MLSTRRRTPVHGSGGQGLARGLQEGSLAERVADQESAMPRRILPFVTLAAAIFVISTWTAPAPEKKSGKAITNSIGMKLVRIPAGKFKMGSPTNEKERSKDEEQHEVEITKEFWMGIHEVTQKEFKAVMGYNPSYFSND